MSARITIPPEAMRKMLQRVAQGRRNSRKYFWRKAQRKIHVARIGTETIESNLPIGAGHDVR